MAISECGVSTNSQGMELKQHGSPAFPVAIYDDDLKAAAVPWHWHDELEAAVVTEGRGVIAIDSHKIVIEKGEGFFVNTGVLHAAWNAEHSACRFHSVVFHTDLIGGNNYSIFWEKYLTPLMHNIKILRLAYSPSCSPSAKWQEEALDMINTAWNFCNNEGRGYEFYVREALSRLVFLLTENLPKAPKISSAERRNAERMKDMLIFIREHFMEQLDTQKIAESAAVSESECLRCFHKVIGTTPIQYLRQYRLKRAEDMLVSSDIKIADIAELCGFQDLSYFSKSFREKNSMTPSEYRSGTSMKR